VYVSKFLVNEYLLKDCVCCIDLCLIKKEVLLKMFKRKLLLPVLVIALCLLFSVFSNAEKVKLVVWAPPFETDTAFDPVLKPAFEKLHPDIEIEFVSVPWREGLQKITAAIISDTLPDLTFGYKAEMALIKAGIFEPIDRFLTEEMKNSYVKGSFEHTEYKGQYYGLPVWADLLVIYYRKDLFEEVGYDSFPRNWEELKECAKKLTVDKNGDGEIDQWLLWADYSSMFLPAYFGPYLYSNGGSWLNEELTRVEIDSPQAIEALEFYIDQALKYNISAPPEKAAKDTVAAFISGQIAAIGEYPWFKGAVRAKAGAEFMDKKVGIALSFKAKKDSKLSFYNSTSGHSIHITKSCKNIEAAWEFAKFMGSKEAQILMWEASDSLPANIEAVKTLKGDRLNSIYSEIVELQESDKDIVFGCEPKLTVTNEIMGQVLIPMVSNMAYGKISVEEGVKEAVTKMNDIISKNEKE